MAGGLFWGTEVRVPCDRGAVGRGFLWFPGSPSQAEPGSQKREPARSRDSWSPSLLIALRPFLLSVPHDT